MSAPLTAEQYRQALVDEYSQYVAIAPIDIDGARAFNVGDPVPASHVERGAVGADRVKKTSTKAGREVAGITSTEKG